MAPTRKRQCEPEPFEGGMLPQVEIIDKDGPIWVNQFTEDSARAFVKQLQYQSGRDPNAPIIIYVDSYGGDVYALLTMISAMEAVPNELITIAFGKAMSAGAVLLAYGDIRYASPHATLMLHEISAGTGGHIADINNEHANIAQLNEKLLKLVATRCKTKGGAAALKKTLEKTRDLYMSPEEGLKFGLIDKIGIPTLHRKLSVEWGMITNLREQVKQGAKDEKQPNPPKPEKPASKVKV